MMHIYHLYLMINLIFRYIYNEQDFSDVSFASDDNKPIEAHKVILSVYSPVSSNKLM